MKQLLFLLLFPAYAMAQYQGNANQKITLGEQTTADGLVFRGVAADTTRKPSVDTMAYILLDTNTNIIWQYKKATSNAWLRLNLLPSDTTSMLTNYYRSGRALGTPSSGTLTNATGLPISTGLTGLGAANRIPYASSTTALTTSSGLTFDGTNFATTGTATATRFNPTGTSATGTGMYLPASNTLGFSIANNQKMNLVSNGIGFGTDLFPWISAISFTLDFPQFAISSGASGGGLISSNFYINQSNQRIYKTTQGASFINTQGGTISFSTAPSGTINTEATFNPISLYIENDGRVAIGSTTLETNYKLTIQDSVYVGGRVSAAGYTTRSDYNLKDEIQTLNYGLNEVIQMQPVKYTYKSNGEQQLGFIAQDIGTLIPESVHFDEFMGVDYQSLIPILTKAIQEQQALIKALEKRILILENK